MEDITQHVERLLKAQFPGTETELEPMGSLRKLSGFLIWPGFEGVEQIDRQHKVWDALRSGLSPDDQSRVSAILTVTPDEIMVMRTG